MGIANINSNHTLSNMKLLYFKVLILFYPVSGLLLQTLKFTASLQWYAVFMYLCAFYFLTSIPVIHVKEEEMARNLNFCNQFGYTISSHCLHVVLTGVYWN
jgi:hypothetical protein